VNIRSRVFRNANSIISKADRFTWMLHYRNRFVPYRQNCERVVQTVRAAGLKRLSAILRSCFSLEEQTLFFLPESPRRNHVDRERNALTKVSFGETTRESLEFKSSDSTSDRPIRDYLRLIRLRRCSIIMNSIRAITD